MKRGPAGLKRTHSLLGQYNAKPPIPQRASQSQVKLPAIRRFSQQQLGGLVADELELYGVDHELEVPDDSSNGDIEIRDVVQMMKNYKM